MSNFRQCSSSTSYPEAYNRIVEKLRESLLSQSSDHGAPYDVVKEIFHKIDENDSGIITLKEMFIFLNLPEMELFTDESEYTAEKFSSLLLEQIDENGYLLFFVFHQWFLLLLSHFPPSIFFSLSLSSSLPLFAGCLSIVEMVPLV
jgi:hypothetical protein